MNFAVADQRILRGTAATLTVTLLNADGDAADAAGTVTVAVAKADGTVVLAAGTATTHGATGVYTVALAANKNATLELLTATWTDAGDGSVATTLVESVGGFFFNVAQARAADTTLTDATAYPDATIRAKRTEVEDECEFICDVAFVPRYRRVTLDGSGSAELALPDNRVRAVRSVRVYSDVGAGTYTAFTAAQLAAIVVDDDNRIERTDFGIFTEGRSNIVVEYEHGWDRPWPTLVGATLVRLRNLLNTGLSGISERATRYTSPDGSSYDLASAGAYKTGLQTVDAIYERYSLRNQGAAGQVPASRSMDTDAEFYSLFHNGAR